MRLFLAVELDEAVRRSAGAVVAELARRVAPGGRGVGWVRPDNLHVTLRFLGEVNEAGTMALVEALRTPIAVAPFDLDVKGVGCFPSAGPPRVLWLGMTAGEESLVRIHREIESRLGSLGFEAEDRPYRAHLTVGRVKGPLPGRPRDILAGMALRPVGRCRVGHVTLFESRLSPKGPTYTPLVTTPLAG